MRGFAIWTAVVLVVAGCGLVPVSEAQPVPPGPLGPIIPGEAGGPPVECRGVPRAECASFANTDGDPDVVRYIVTCTSVCTPEKGDVRIDVLGANGRTRSVGGGSYSSGAAVPEPAVPEPAETAPASEPGTS